MSVLEITASLDTTSAAGPMAMRKLPGPVLVGYMLVGLGTSAANALPPDTQLMAQYSTGSTNSGMPSTPSSSGAAIAELRRRSGLTWDQLARLFGVSRRALHFWASGKPMSPTREEHLQRVLAVVRQTDRGSASATRTSLLEAREDGSLPIDRLAAGEYDRVVSLLGIARPSRATAAQLSERARARAPRPPEELVGALHDRIHPASGRLLAAKPIPVPRRK